MSWSEALRNAPWARRAGALAWALPALLGAGEERMSDAQAATYAQRALVLVAAGDRETALQRLSSHVFRGSKAPEREIVLFAIGVLQDRLGRVREAADTLRKLEKAFPQSLYLEAAQVVLAEEALDHKRLPEAEQRLKRVLASEQPVETKRRAQEMLLWALAEQDRAKEGLEILDTLHPLPSQEHPSERGLVAMFEVAAANSDRKRAEAFHREYLRTYKNGPLLPRVELDWGRVLGAAGQSRESAQALRAMIRDFPKSPEANEARLALATLMADGKLSDRIRRAFPAPERLIAELEGITTNSDPGRRALVLKLRLAVQASEWGRALALAQQYRSTFANGPELETVGKLWGEAYRAKAQQVLERGDAASLLDSLNAESAGALLPEQRLSLVRKLAKTGLSAPLPALVGWAPEDERPRLRAGALQELSPEAHAEVVLRFLPGRGEGPRERLLRAKAEVALGHWAAARVALAAAAPGPERIAAVLMLLHRPEEAREPLRARLREAEAQFVRAPEPAAVKEPLLIRVADLRAQTGDWRGAASLYPAHPSKENQGWVALMKATAQWRLGQKEAAKATLKAAEEAEAFRPERQTLQKDVGM